MIPEFMIYIELIPAYYIANLPKLIYKIFKNTIMTIIETKQKAAVIINLMQTIAECIKGHTNGLPSGVLYSQLMCFGITLQQYDNLINAYVNSGVVKKKGNLLFWVAG